MLSSDQLRSRFNQDKWKSGGAETPCGVGSTIDESRIVSKLIKDIITEWRDVKTVNDAGCGDMNWVSMLRPFFIANGIDYLGYDIRPWSEAYPMPFEELDIINGVMRECDVIICRDVLFHFPNEYVLQAIANFKKAGRGLLATTTPSEMGPVDNSKRIVEVGGFAPIDLEGEPFCLGEPMMMLMEHKWRRCVGFWSLV